MPGFNNSKGRSSGRYSRGSSARRNFGGRTASRGSDKRSSPRGGGDFRRGAPMEKTKVTCADCGETCEVPFKPTSNKPVFCSDCFRKQEKDSKGPTMKDINDINKKLDKIMTALKIE